MCRDSLTELGSRLDEWAERVRASRSSRRSWRGIRAEIERDAGPELADTYAQAAPPEQLYAGLERYWRKQAPGSRRRDRWYPVMMSLTVELPRVGGPGSGIGGLWRVVVLNDDFNTFDHVAETLARVIPGVTLAEGYRFADRIHNTGLRDRLERLARGRRDLLGAARRRRADDGPARGGLARSP